MLFIIVLCLNVVVKWCLLAKLAHQLSLSSSNSSLGRLLHTPSSQRYWKGRIVTTYSLKQLSVEKSLVLFRYR